MKFLYIIPLAIISFSSIAATNTFLCNKQITNPSLCIAADKIKKNILTHKFKGENTPLLHKKLYIKTGVLIDQKLRLNTVFSQAINPKKMASKEFKKKTLQKTFKKICSNGSDYRKYIESNGTVLLKFSYSVSSRANLPKDVHIISCRKAPAFDL